MCASQNFSTLDCELRIIRAKNVEFVTTGDFFVRCYLSAGSNKRIRLNSREIPPTCSPSWNEGISLRCSGTRASVEGLKQQGVVFEFRQRSTTPILGRIAGSKLLGTAQLSWREVLESPDMNLEKWITMVSTSSRALEGLKPPPLIQIGVKVQVSAGTSEMPRRKKDVKSKRWDECGCRHGRCTVGDDHIFALAAALEAL